MSKYIRNNARGHRAPFPLLGGGGSSSKPYTMLCGHSRAKGMAAVVIPPGREHRIYGYVFRCSTCEREYWLAHDWHRKGLLNFNRLELNWTSSSSTPTDRIELVEEECACQP